MTTRSARLAGLAGLCISLTTGLAPAGFDGIDGGAQHAPAAAKAHADWCTQCNHGEGLPTYDIRVDDAVYSAIATAAAQVSSEKAFASAGALRGTVPMLAIDFDESLGTPKFIRSTAGFLTGHSRDAAWEAVVGGFASANRALIGFGPDELTRNRVIRDFTMAHNGVRNLTVQQVHAGVDVFGATLRTSLTSKGELINISSTMLDRPAEGFAVEQVKLTAARAAVLAAADAGVKIDESELSVAEEEVGPERKSVWKSPAALRSDEALVTKLVYFPLTRDLLVPAWTVVVAQHGTGHTYDTVIDATDGKVLFRSDRLVCAAPITFNVYTNDSPAPMSPGYNSVTSSQASFAARSLVTVNPGDVSVWSPQGWIPDGTFETLGNNIDAHTDTDANNSADLPRPTSATLNFDFPLDLSLSPSGYKDAAVTQMFYLCNGFHDRLYALGFTEAAGNFQNDNFGLGGTAGDRVQADVQDGSGTNNANFGTSGSDGSSARVQMYVWTGPNPDRDGSLESDIVYHEMAHGVSIRMHGGLSSIQSTGMGEGWSDFIALSINTQAGDDPDAVYTMGPYATYQLSGLSSNYYFGIRRYPYSTNLLKGPLTFGDIDSALYNVSGTVPRSPIAPSGSNSDVHDYGEVWCQILWECRAAMVHAHGYAGNQLMLQLVIDGMAVSPTNPTFIQARDAILQSDQTNNGGANLATLWTAFAKRGMGFGAVAPAATTTSGVTESFSTPIFATFSFPDGLPSQLSPVSPTSFNVSITGTGLTLTPASGTLSYRVNGGSFSTVAMTPTGTNQYLATLPAQPCLAKVDYYVSVDTSAGARTSPATAPTAFNAATVFTSTVTVANDTFETNTAWTTGPNTATAGNWVRTNPLGTAAQPEDDHTAAPGVNCWFTGQGTGGAIGEADIDGGQTLLTSPSYDLSAVADATVSYWRWYSNGAGAVPYTDTFRVYVSVNDGASWTLAETVGPASSVDTNPGWRFASWTLSSLGLTPSAQVKVRFLAEDAGSGSLVEAAVDDFAISGLVCTAGPTPCGPADLGGQGGIPGADGSLDNNDFVIFISSFFDQLPVADLGVQGGQLGSDGEFDNNDFIAFIELFFSGC